MIILRINKQGKAHLVIDLTPKQVEEDKERKSPDEAMYVLDDNKHGHAIAFVESTVRMGDDGYHYHPLQLLIEAMIDEGIKGSKSLS